MVKPEPAHNKLSLRIKINRNEIPQRCETLYQSEEWRESRTARGAETVREIVLGGLGSRTAMKDLRAQSYQLQLGRRRANFLRTGILLQLSYIRPTTVTNP